MNDYERIARVIRFLDQRHAEQPDLTALARRAGLSQFHFHRLFSTWAGVTPKDFLQCLTLTRARELLHGGANVMDAALESGLSGPGRLHDLCVSLEAASPGELKSGGAGWTISYGFAASPFGKCLIAESPRGICHLSFIENERIALAGLQQEWPSAKLQRGAAAAARAVGAAVGQNSLAYLIPCHRVIRETGVIGDYRWGQNRKRAMIAWESSQFCAKPPAPAIQAK